MPSADSNVHWIEFDPRFRPLKVDDAGNVRALGDCQQEPSPSDIIFADLEMVVVKAESLKGFQWAKEVLPNRLMLIMAARQISMEKSP